jgi:F0F1-type ATP synthase membrane subunit b/b'
MSDLPPPSDPPTGPTPPTSESQPTDRPDVKQPWPGKAKAAVAIFVVLTLLGIAGTIIGFTRASSEEEDNTKIEAELAEALARAEEAEAQLADTQATLAETEVTLATTTAERDEALATVEQRDAEVAELNEKLAAAEEEIAARDRIITDLAEPFPVAIDPDLTTTPVDGQYSVVLTEVRCFNLPQCGSVPGIPNSTLARAGDQLLLNVPGRFQITLIGRDRQLFGDSNEVTLIDGCGTQPRPQSTRIAIHAASGQVQLDGSVDLSRLGASIVVDAPATAECPAGEVWYAATLTRLG